MTARSCLLGGGTIKDKVGGKIDFKILVDFKNISLI